jgi:EmrB/QacA subfamily drug resistance transporter
VRLLPMKEGGYEGSDSRPSRFLVPPGYSRLKIHENADVREIDLIIPNEALPHITEFFPLLISARPFGRLKNGIDSRAEPTDMMETLTPVSPYSTESTDMVETSFKISPLTGPIGAVETNFKPAPSLTKTTGAVETLEPISFPFATSTISVSDTNFNLAPPLTKLTDEEETFAPISPPSLPQPAAPSLSNARKWQIAAVVVIGLFLSVMDNTIISVTLPQMQRAFHTDFATITWVATIYFLAQAAVIPIVGYLCDRFGSKLVFLTSLSLFTVGSLLCALSPTKEALITFRVIQGIGGGALFPLAFAITFPVFAANERGKAAAFIGVPVLMAPAFGPTLGGYLSTTYDWYAIFLINVPFGIVGLVLALLILPGRKFEEAQRMIAQAQGVKKSFDILGLLLSMLGFTILTYGISEASSKGWSDQTVLTALAVGGVVIIVLIVVELLVRDPVIDPRLFLNYTFSISNLLSAITIAVFYGSLFLLPLFFENVQNNPALTTGEFLISQGLLTGVGVAIAGALYNRVGPRILSALGVILLAAGTYMLTQIDINTTGQSLQVTLALRGLGMGLITPPLQTLAISVVDNRAIARASSLVSIIRQLASAVGVAGLTTYLTQQTITHATDIGNTLRAGVQTHQFSGVAATCIQVGGPTQNVAAIRDCVIQHATTSGLDDTFWVVLILTASCILLGLIVGRDPAIEAYKKAKARGEKVELRPQPIGE